MNIFYEIFLLLMTALQFLFPFAFKDTEETPEQPTDSVIEEVVPGDHVHVGGNCLTGAICDICGEVYAEEGEHVYIVNAKQATCTEAGYVNYRCNLCFYSFTGSETPAKGHSYTEKVVEATCTSAGYIITSCSGCGATDTTRTEDPKGHKFEYIKTIPADCTNPAMEVYTCYGCNTTNYKSIPGTVGGHNYSEVVTLPTCRAQGYTTYTCSICNDSYKGDYADKIPHDFKDYVYQNNATCTSDGTKIAYCSFGCGTRSEAITAEGTMLQHKDVNLDTKCDDCGGKIYFEYSYLKYTDKAVAKVGTGADVNSVATFIARADEDYAGGELYPANKGTTYNSIIESTYFNVFISGKLQSKDGSVAEGALTKIPVYGTTVYVGETADGALHSFSEIYVDADEYCTFEIEIRELVDSLTVNSVAVLPESAGVSATFNGSTIKAVISGYGAYTFLINGDQRYVYTITVREEVDEDKEIADLVAGGYTVYVVGDDENLDRKDLPYVPYPSYVDDISAAAFVNEDKNVIYLRKGSYMVAPHQFDINSEDDDRNKPETGADPGTGQNRWAFITAKNCTNFKVLGYGAFDLGHLDRAERRGMIISFSTNVEIRGVKLFNSPEWTCFFYRCFGLTVKDVDVYGYRQNSDAFDICNVQGGTVTDCFARTGDDCFIVKTLGGDENAYSEDVTVSNCYAWTGKARAFGIFGEAYHHISDVTFKDCAVLCHDAVWDYTRIPAIGIVMESEGDAKTDTINVQNITFDNIEICRNDARAINVVVFGEKEFPTKPVTINNITFSNIRYKSANQNLIDKYNPRTTITNVTFKDVYNNGTLLTDSNKSTYFTSKSYEGGYINFENTK